MSKKKVGNEATDMMSTPKHLYHLRERLEKQMEGSHVTPQRQVSPTLEKLKMTPGRVLKDREMLASKHLNVRKKADKLNVGGGVSVWPGMDDMRLSRWEILELFIVSIILCVAVLYGFHQLHGSTIEELWKYQVILRDFPDQHHVTVSDSSLNSDLHYWHKSFRKLMGQIHSSFDMSTVPLMYIMYMLVYSGGIGFLVYCLVDNMLAKSKLSPNRIKQWVSILVVIFTWTGALFYFLLAAYMMESSVEKNISRLTHILGEALDRDIDTTKLVHTINYWETIPRTGTLSVLGLLTVRDFMHYLQYYFVPVVTILITPIVKLILSLYSVYHIS